MFVVRYEYLTRPRCSVFRKGTDSKRTGLEIIFLQGTRSPRNPFRVVRLDWREQLTVGRFGRKTCTPTTTPSSWTGACGRQHDRHWNDKGLRRRDVRSSRGGRRHVVGTCKKKKKKTGGRRHPNHARHARRPVSLRRSRPRTE